jgi:Tfp pilus assembly protein FimV
MSRTHVRRRRAAALGVGILIAIVAPRAAAIGGDAAPFRGSGPGRMHVVRPGDTVWDIARSEAGGSDPRSMVDAIIEANGLGGASIVPGQPLVVPDR